MCVCLCLCVCMYVCVYNKPSLKSAYWSIKFSVDLSEVGTYCENKQKYARFFLCIFLFLFFGSLCFHSFVYFLAYREIPSTELEQKNERLFLSHYVWIHTIHSLLSIYFFYLPFFLKIAFSLSFSLCISFVPTFSLSFLILNGFKFMILFLSCLFSIFLSRRLLMFNSRD